VSAAEAVQSERALFPHTRELAPDDPAIGKTLLTRPTGEPLPARATLVLTPIVSEADWSRYERARIEVEAGFGVGPDEARAMVGALRERGGLSLFFADPVVGAVGYFVTSAGARLQEVDIFPAWRGKGYGDALLAAVLQHLADRGIETAIIGADEDDWPLGWYRRRGFTPVARVTLSRSS
jgi:GNAT superfamily N-acetyltransferase